MSDKDSDRSGDRGGDLYSSDFGDSVRGGAVNFDYDKAPGKDHVTVQGDDRHFSWNIDKHTGEVSDVHGTDDTTGKRW